MKPRVLRFDGTAECDPAIQAWFKKHPEELGKLAYHWFEVMRKCGDEVREVLHDGCPVVCFGDVAFAYVNAFKAHVNVGFFQGASLGDPSCLLEGSGKFMRHVKLRPGTPTNSDALNALITAAYTDIQRRVAD